MNENKDPFDKLQNKEDIPDYLTNREMFYGFDKEHGFTKELSYQNQATQVIIEQGWDAVEARLEDVKERVRSGKVSPVAYYMEKMLMELPMLSAYMGLNLLRVRWHMTPTGFRRLKPSMLERYARLFEITVEELKKPGFMNK